MSLSNGWFLIVNSTVVLFFSGNEAISLKVNSGTDGLGMKMGEGLGVGILGGGVKLGLSVAVGIGKIVPVGEGDDTVIKGRPLDKRSHWAHVTCTIKTISTKISAYAVFFINSTV